MNRTNRPRLPYRLVLASPIGYGGICGDYRSKSRQPFDAIMFDAPPEIERAAGISLKSASNSVGPGCLGKPGSRMCAAVLEDGWFHGARGGTNADGASLQESRRASANPDPGSAQPYWKMGGSIERRQGSGPIKRCSSRTVMLGKRAAFMQESSRQMAGPHDAL